MGLISDAASAVGFTISSPSNVVMDDGRAIYLGVGIFKAVEPEVIEFLRGHPLVTEVIEDIAAVVPATEKIAAVISPDTAPAVKAVGEEITAVAAGLAASTAAVAL